MSHLTRLIYVLVLLFLEIDMENADEWVLFFEDNFDGLEVNDSYWQKWRETWPSSKQLQYYNESNVYIEDGKLVIKTEYKPVTVDGRDYLYQSGIIQSKDRAPNFIGGKFEISAKLSNPEFTRLHNSIWLQKANGSCYQEIDIMEYWTGRKTGGKYMNHANGAYHFNNASNSEPGCGPGIDPRNVYTYPYWLNGERRGGHGPSASIDIDCSDPNNPYLCGNGTWHEDYSNWTVVWNVNDSLTYYIDGVEVGYVNSSNGTMPYQPMYLIINTAVCNKSSCLNYGDLVTDKIAYFYIDYVRVYTLTPTMSPTQTPTTYPTPTGHTFYTSSNGNYIGVDISPTTNQLTWSEANDYCVDIFGTQLATVLTADDHNEIESSLLNEFSSWYLWIGWRDYNGLDIWLPCDSSDCTQQTCTANATDELSATWHTSEPKFDDNECGTIKSLTGTDFGSWFDKTCTDKKDFICNAPYGKYGNGVPFECDSGSSANSILYRRNPMNDDHVEYISNKRYYHGNDISFISILMVICITLILNICIYSLIYIVCIKSKFNQTIRTGSYKYNFVDNKEEIHFIDE